MNRKPYDCPTLLIVAQRPFETDSGTFCKLLPLLYLDGDHPKTSEFPNDGEVWWMLTERTRGFAEPGRLVVGNLEPAVRFDESDMTKSSVQAVIGSIRDPDKDDVFQLVRLASEAISSPQDLVENFRISADTRRIAQVVLKWREHYYGPFRTVDADDGPSAARQFRLAPQDPARNQVLRFPAATFERLVRTEELNVSVSSTSSPRRVASERDLHRVRFECFLASFLPVLQRESTRETLTLEPIGLKLRRAANLCFQRKQAQEFRRHLEELELKASDQRAPAELLEAVRARRGAVESDLAGLEALATAMLESGLLGEDRLEQVERQIADRYLRQHGEALKAKLEKDLSAARRDLEEIEREKMELRSELERESARHRQEFLVALEREREEQLRFIEAERIELQKQQSELARLEEVLRNNLSEVTRDLRDAGDDVINRFLTIEPLLGRGRMASGGPILESAQAAPQQAGDQPTPFRPRARTRSDSSPPKPVPETAFIERVLRRAAQRGLQYRRSDVERFHLSVKTGALTVLSGPSGTGKSSLASVYGEALRGESPEDLTSHLMVSVSPTWMDGRDLLGHVAGARRFAPAESGLFEFLATAQEESKELRGNAAIFVAVLDEINLAQPEHYFGEILLALERTGESRRIRCFAPTEAGADCPFRAFPSILLADSLRFVGTMNDDETTRRLSDRFLDRANLIRLPAGAPASSFAATAPQASDSERIITADDFDRWSVSQPLDPEIAKFADRLRPIMEQFGSPISQRVSNAMHRYISCSGNLIRQEQAIDHQVCQRVLPKIRSVINRRQDEAFAALRLLLTRGGFELPESLSALDAIDAREREVTLDEE